MAEKKRPTAKRPPAHEVILGMLTAHARVLYQLRIRSCVRTSSTTSEEQDRMSACGALLTVLDRMHLPEREEPKIHAALRELEPEVIGVHRSHVRLLKRLGGRSPAHAMGTKPTRRRA